MTSTTLALALVAAFAVLCIFFAAVIRVARSLRMKRRIRNLQASKQIIDARVHRERIGLAVPTDIRASQAMYGEQIWRESIY